jgi:hypothetical protein
MLIGTSVRDPRGLIEVSVIVSAIPAPLYRLPSGGRPYVEGPVGAEYSLLVRNHTSGRIEVVNSVDGRNTQKDEMAGPDSRGLVIRPHGEVLFDGWRLDDSLASAFVFTRPQRSIATQATGSTGNVGVIGFAVYTELVQETFRAKGATRGATFDYDEEDEDEPPVVYRGMQPGGVRRGSVGTGRGQEHHSPVVGVRFVRMPGEPSVLEIGYDQLAWLLQEGYVSPPPARPAEPRAFPGMSPGYTGYGEYRKTR